MPNACGVDFACGLVGKPFNVEDPVETIVRLTRGSGADRAIDAVGVDATQPHGGPAASAGKAQAGRFRKEVQEVAPETNPRGDNWHPGNAPSPVLSWAMEALAKAGNSVCHQGLPSAGAILPDRIAMNKNLVIMLGNCNHRKYTPKLLDLVRSGSYNPAKGSDTE